MTINVAIIGAGIAGITCATELQNHNIAVTIFDKGRKPGGRLSSRHDSSGNIFDHGAQYFTVRSPYFARMAERMLAAGVIQEWNARLIQLNIDRSSVLKSPASVDRRFVGAPSMSAVPAFLSSTLNDLVMSKVIKVHRQRGWSVSVEAGQSYGSFTHIVFAMPPVQILALLDHEPVDDLFRSQLQSATLRPSWALMLTMEESVDLGFDAAFVAGDSPIAWIADQFSKPSRIGSGPSCWTIHASPKWSEEHIEADKDFVIEALTDAFYQLIAAESKKPKIKTAAAHRWRYALPDPSIKVDYLSSNEQKIYACGDWCNGPRVEGAVLSAYKLAHDLMKPASRPQHQQAQR